MRKLSILLAAMLILTFVQPAAAKTKVRERIGERLNLLTGTPETFPGRTPFHIAHGWTLADDSTTPPSVRGAFGFELEVDGALRQPSFRERLVDESVEPPIISVFWVHNFPRGMRGAHTLVGRWYAPCQWSVDQGMYPGPCETPLARVEILRMSHTVKFVKP